MSANSQIKSDDCKIKCQGYKPDGKLIALSIKCFKASNRQKRSLFKKNWIKINILK